MTKPVKVAVIGGGCASMAAAFELTRPQHRGRYQVTVYQQGWRLGGKGASGRGAGNRIEEHGLHLWMGFYENAFRLMRDCYDELGRDPERYRIADWTHAFVPAPLVGVADRRDGAWQIWKTILPPASGLPGDPPYRRRFTLVEYLDRSLELLRALFRTLQEGTAESDAPPPSPDGSRDDVLRRVTQLLRYGELGTLAAMVEAVSLLEMIVGSASQYPENLALRLLDAISNNARAQIRSMVETDRQLRRVWLVIDLVLATLRGELRFGVFADPRGFDILDEYDCREWLLLNGASEDSVNSGFVRGLYDLGFSYEDGDAKRPRIAAGQALRGVVRSFFTYRGSFFWKMTSGMGDVVFAPLYEVLKRRGVRFEFFHRLRNVKLAPRDATDPGDSPHVGALEFDVQAKIEGDREYQPLIDVSGLPCWPSKPDFAQLVDGGQIERERDFESYRETRRASTKILRVSEHFDFVVLGVGLGAIPHVCREIVSRDPRWRAMVDHVKTVATQSFQIWMRPDMKDLGWTDGPVSLSGFAQPFDTWADMSHLIPEESYSPAPRALAYFCSVLSDAEAAESDAAGCVRRNAVRFLNRDIQHLWPRAARAEGGFRWDLLADPSPTEAAIEGTGESRFDSQYWRANAEPSDRYALSLPGSNVYRISPLDPTYDNLTVAGDWTQCGFNAGCVEAAVMSGRLAAHALSQSPPLEEIVGYDHP
jgi:uncharacterized protein with NAD-binding domain and iron-sulfur cluster